MSIDKITPISDMARVLQVHVTQAEFNASRASDFKNL